MVTARKQQPSDKREAILAAALELFVGRGFYGTAVPDIAARAGVGAGTIYRHFRSKESLVNELYQHRKLEFSSAMLEGFPVGAPTREQFRSLWMRMAKYATDHPDAFFFLELNHHAAYLDRDSMELERRGIHLFDSVIVSAQKRGELKQGSPRMLMGIVMGAFVGCVRNCFELQASLSTADWAFAEQCLWEAIRA